MGLEQEISGAAVQIATDSYDMSLGELINIYQDGELIINPEFQRLFRWTPYQKSHLIESLLLGIPIPPIFVFERPDGKWELIDGLQRVSTILELVGVLKDGDEVRPPLVLDATKYLPSLQGAVWDRKFEGRGRYPLSKTQQLALKRARIGVQILKKKSDETAKFDLFQRLNSHSSDATPQELRNSVLVLMNPPYYTKMKTASRRRNALAILQPSERGQKTQAMMDFVTRFIVFLLVDYDKRWDIEEYLNNGIIEIAGEVGNSNEGVREFNRTIDLLMRTDESDILKRYSDGEFKGRVGQAAFEVICLGVAQNYDAIDDLVEGPEWVLERAKELWEDQDFANFTRAGLRGTDRIQKTIPFGRAWFDPE